MYYDVVHDHDPEGDHHETRSHPRPRRRRPRRGGRLAGCGGGSSAATTRLGYATPASATTGSAGAKVVTRRTKLGNVLVDGRGRTLYLFEKDKGTASTCYGACASVWPPLRPAPRRRPPASAARASAPPGARTARPRSPSRATRSTRTPATQRGDVKGQGLDQFGAEWYVLGANGHKIEDALVSRGVPGSSRLLGALALLGTAAVHLEE